MAALVGILLAVGLCVTQLQGLPLNLVVEHSFDGATFSSAGTIATVEVSFAGQPGDLVFERRPFTSEEVKSFNQASRSYGFYHLRVALEKSSSEHKKYAHASFPARCLAAAGLHEQLTLHLSSAGDVLALSYGTPVEHACTPAVLDSSQPA